MPRRSVLVALVFAGLSQLSTGCACNRPLFPRLRCLVCGPDGAPPAGPAYSPVSAGAFGPPPVVAGPPVGAPAFSGAGMPGGFSPVGYPAAGMSDLPHGAIPVGPPITTPVGAGPMQGPIMQEPHAALPGKAMPAGFAPLPPTASTPPVFNGPSTPLGFPASGPMPVK